jgi:hypothetical protein
MASETLKRYPFAKKPWEPLAEDLLSFPLRVPRVLRVKGVEDNKAEYAEGAHKLTPGDMPVSA